MRVDPVEEQDIKRLLIMLDDERVMEKLLNLLSASNKPRVNS